MLILGELIMANERVRQNSMLTLGELVMAGERGRQMTICLSERDSAYEPTPLLNLIEVLVQLL